MAQKVLLAFNHWCSPRIWARHIPFKRSGESIWDIKKEYWLLSTAMIYLKRDTLEQMISLL
jgi:hypothetical protein